jgi:ribosomal protein L22
MAEEKTKIEKKKTAIVNGKDLPVGLKHAIALCNFIRGKDIDTVIPMLEEVTRLKRAIPMRGEIPHRHGMMSGRYPVKGSKEFIILLKSLKSNAIVNELELEKYIIACSSNLASRPYKRFGQGRVKRCHVTIQLIESTKKKKTKKEIKK